ncbi:MAG: carbohydrate porin [Leptolyngbyaceae cyanobacterium SU_3_3]|nr:carbohydrate porin [Leptolyngbyaceae cyanobacterium SU_3_3]
MGLITRSFYSNPTGEGGLFGSTDQGIVELEYKPSAAAIRLAYSGGELFDNRFNAIGANVEWAVTPQLGFFGRYSRGNYDNTAFNHLNPRSWMARLSLRNVGRKGAIAGFAIGQPLVESRLGSGTQTNLEAFYNDPISNNLRLSPIFQFERIATIQGRFNWSRLRPNG